MTGDSKTEFGQHQGECAGCEHFRRVNELGLCEDGSQKLERDLIRNRDWAYSATAYWVGNERREELLRQIVDKFGKDLELIAPSRQVKVTRKRRRRRRRK